MSHLQSVAATCDGGQTWTCSFCHAVVGVSHTCEGLSGWIAERLLPPAVEAALDAHAEAMAPPPLNHCPRFVYDPHCTQSDGCYCFSAERSEAAP